jgi:hypothetical protein
MCTVALDPASLQGRAPAPPCVLWLQTLPPSREGSDVAVHPVVPCGPHASSIKKSLVGMPVQLGSCVFKAHAHVFNTSDTRAIMGLQDMRAGGTFNAHMTCGQAATVRLQCNTALLTTRKAPLQCQVTRHHDATLQTECDLAGQ